MKKITHSFIGAIALLAFAVPFTAHAKLFFQDFSVSLLSGSDYDPQKLDNGNQTQSEERTVVTFEHASGWSWGSTFLFVDRLIGKDDGFENSALYGEFQPNISIAKLAGWDLKGGFVKDFMFATQWEFGSGDNGPSRYEGREGVVDANAGVAERFDSAGSSNSFNNFLYGFGVSLAVPKASFFNVFLYARSNDEQVFDRLNNNERGDNNQLTVVWRFDFANDKARFDGFLDYATSFDLENAAGDQVDGNGETSINFTPQLKYDIGQAFGVAPKKFWAGIEWVKWDNKFGNEDWDENNVNLLLKRHF